jgi:DNA topoisomerase-1
LDGKPVTAAIGRFGPYIKFGSTFVTITKEYDPYHITLAEADKLIKDKQEKEANKYIKSFPEDEKLQIVNGRFGPYISYDKANYKIPKDVVPAEISFEEVMKIIKAAPEKPAKGKGKGKPAASANKKKAKAKKSTK